MRDALTLLDERDAEFVEEHPSWFSSNYGRGFTKNLDHATEALK